ncbi:MAG: protein-L-isoaspartate O-methyltransferase [Xanthomonadales bacterium]|nr:protein-L-isoaspartate O-methyltransferase [Xanthomonadales bacterium]
MNFNTARKNMLLNQVRTWDFISPEVLNTMRKLQREEFVPVEHRKLAFSDFEIPLAHDESMMKPIVEGRILQNLHLNGAENILEVGTGSAYFTALLALSAKKVTSIDIHQDFIDSAEEKLSEAKIKNCELLCENIFEISSRKKYDVIVITGSMQNTPDFLLKNLNKGGKIFAIIGDEPIMSACLITKNENGETNFETLFETVVKPLSGQSQHSNFKL